MRLPSLTLLLIFVPYVALAQSDQGWKLCNSEDADAAIPACTNLIEAEKLDPKDRSAALSSRASAYARKHDYDRAFADADKAIEFNPQNSDAYMRRGAAYGNKGDHERAFADENKAIELDPRNVKAYANRGLGLARKGDDDRAIADLTKAIEIDSKFAFAYVNRANIYGRKGDFDRTIADATKAIEIDQKNSYAYGLRAQAYENKGDYDLAIADYAAQIEIEPKNFWYARELGLLHFYKGDFKLASADLLHALELKDDLYVMLFRYLARAHTGEGEAAEAELAENAQRWKVKVWPYAFIELYLGKRSPDAMLAAAVRQSDRCLVQFYVGEWHTLKGNSGEAMTALSTAVEMCAKNSLEYRAATAELARLKP
jgi:tetratricopeptide (TPR) repeat protein